MLFGIDEIGYNFLSCFTRAYGLMVSQGNKKCTTIHGLKTVFGDRIETSAITSYQLIQLIPERVNDDGGRIKNK